MKYLLCFTFLLFSVCVNANLLISPTRVNFNDRDRIQEVILVNTGSQERTYRIGWVEKKAKETGGYEDIELSDETVSGVSPYIRFSPRQVKLQSGERQVVKLQLRKKANMNELEYRSHLAFTVLPPKDNNASANTEPADGMRMLVNMYLSYSIPVLYHPVKPEASVTIIEHSLKKRTDDSADIQLMLARKGQNSAYGRIEVYANVEGIETRIGLLNNVAVYKELNSLVTSVRIPNYKNYANIQEVKIKYIGEKEFAGHTHIEKTVRL